MGAKMKPIRRLVTGTDERGRSMVAWMATTSLCSLSMIGRGVPAGATRPDHWIAS